MYVLRAPCTYLYINLHYIWESTNMAFFQWSRRSVALDYHKFPTRNLEDNLQTAQHTRTGHLLPSLPSPVLPPPGTSAAGMHGHYGGRSRAYFIQHHMGPFG